MQFTMKMANKLVCVWYLMNTNKIKKTLKH